MVEVESKVGRQVPEQKPILEVAELKKQFLAMTDLDEALLHRGLSTILPASLSDFDYKDALAALVKEARSFHMKYLRKLPVLLGELPDSDSITHLASLVNEVDHELQKACIYALSTIAKDNDGANAALITIATSHFHDGTKDLAVQRLLCDKLAGQNAPILLSNEATRAFCIHSLSNFTKPPIEAKHLTESLADSTIRLDRIVSILGSMADLASIELLVKVARADLRRECSDEIRVAATKALALKGHSTLTATACLDLATNLDTPEPIAIAAAATLENLALIKNDDLKITEERAELAKALGAFFEENFKTLPWNSNRQYLPKECLAYRVYAVGRAAVAFGGRFKDPDRLSDRLDKNGAMLHVFQIGFQGDSKAASRGGAFDGFGVYQTKGELALEVLGAIERQKNPVNLATLLDYFTYSNEPAVFKKALRILETSEGGIEIIKECARTLKSGDKRRELISSLAKLDQEEFFAEQESPIWRDFDRKDEGEIIKDEARAINLVRSSRWPSRDSILLSRFKADLDGDCVIARHLKGEEQKLYTDIAHTLLSSENPEILLEVFKVFGHPNSYYHQNAIHNRLDQIAPGSIPIMIRAYSEIAEGDGKKSLAKLLDKVVERYCESAEFHWVERRRFLSNLESLPLF